MKAHKQDSDRVGLRIALEDNPKTLPTEPLWLPFDPNSYGDFGGEVSTVARQTINASRQRQKGPVVDLDASAAFELDLTQNNFAQLCDSFFFAEKRVKDELNITAVVEDTTDSFTVESGGASLEAGDLIFSQGLENNPNNGLHLVTGVPTATSVPVTSELVAAADQSGLLRRVGYQFASGDASVDVSGDFPRLVLGTKDPRELDLNVGEYVVLGGDLTAESFNTTENNTIARVRSVDETSIEFDKTDSLMANDAGAGKTIRVFFAPRVVKNESNPDLIQMFTHQLERTLGVPDRSEPEKRQADYVVGAVGSEWELSMPTAGKVTMNMTYTAMDYQLREADEGPKSEDVGANAPDLNPEDAYNTSNHFTRVRVSPVVEADAHPEPLFMFLNELSIRINNNVTPNKGLGVLGAFDMSAGLFEVGGSANAYLADLSAQKAVRENQDITIDLHLMKTNHGISLDIPLCTLSDAKPNVEGGQAITVPVTIEAASGAKIDPGLDHSMMMMFWDYVPDHAS